MQLKAATLHCDRWSCSTGGKRVSAHVATILLLVLLAFLVGCTRVPEGKPGIEGAITELETIQGGDSVQILVEASQDGDYVSDKAYVLVIVGSAIFILEDGSHREVGMDVLEEGMVVQVWFDGPVAESYPVQGTAEAVVVVR